MTLEDPVRSSRSPSKSNRSVRGLSHSEGKARSEGAEGSQVFDLEGSANAADEMGVGTASVSLGFEPGA